MTTFGKHTLQNLKPYEIVIENRDPILGPNSPDAPAGFSRIQRRKWKHWINPISGNEFIRKSKYENEWILKPSGSCPGNIVNYDNHTFIGRTKAVAGQQEYGWDMTALGFPGEYSIGFFHDSGTGVNINPNVYNTLQEFVDAIQSFAINSQFPGYTLTFELVGSTPYIYITGDNGYTLTGFNLTIFDVTNSVLVFSEVFTSQITLVAPQPAGPCEQIDITPETFDPLLDKPLFIKPEISGLLNGTYRGHSGNPVIARGGGQLSFVPGNYALTIDMDTDGIAGTFAIPTAYYNTLQSIIDALNSELTIQGSSFRYIAVNDYTIITADINGNPLFLTDPYFAANSYISLALTIENTDTLEFMPKGNKSDKILLDNVTYITQPSGLHTGTIPTGVSTYLPTPQIRYLKNDPSSDGILFEAYFNQADRWILDYEPEIYLYFIKGGGGWKNHTNRATKKRIAHMAQTNTLGEPISFKLDVNPRLRSETGRVNEHNTEWTVDGTKPDMATVFTVQPFQFLGRPTYSSNGSGAFPVNPNIWNALNTGTEYPPTLSSRSIGDQDLAPNRDITITVCFKLVIRNPQNPTGFPIESDISEIFKIRPNVPFGSVDYNNRQVKVNR